MLTLVKDPDPIAGRISGANSRHDERKRLTVRLHIARLNYYRTPTAAYRRLVERCERDLARFDGGDGPDGGRAA